jgi:5-methylcytosine-specific restriction endonuclease McrA
VIRFLLEAGSETLESTVNELPIRTVGCLRHQHKNGYSEDGNNQRSVLHRPPQLAIRGDPFSASSELQCLTVRKVTFE